LHVSYLFIKGKRTGKTPAKVEWVIFFITEKTTDRQYYFKEYKTVFTFIAGTYSEMTAMRVANWLLDNKRIVAAYNQVKKMHESILLGIIKKHGKAAYLLAVLNNLGVPNDIF
jgi:hypothetical protein